MNWKAEAVTKIEALESEISVANGALNKMSERLTATNARVMELEAENKRIQALCWDKEQEKRNARTDMYREARDDIDVEIKAANQRAEALAGAMRECCELANGYDDSSGEHLFGYYLIKKKSTEALIAYRASKGEC